MRRRKTALKRQILVSEDGGRVLLTALLVASFRVLRVCELPGGGLYIARRFRPQLGCRLARTLHAPCTHLRSSV
jgi:hypothetical protein